MQFRPQSRIDWVSAEDLKSTEPIHLDDLESHFLALKGKKASEDDSGDSDTASSTAPSTSAHGSLVEALEKIAKKEDENGSWSGSGGAGSGHSKWQDGKYQFFPKKPKSEGRSGP